MADHSPDDQHQQDWIETVAKLAGTLGFNEVRVRWKLRRWRDQRQAKRAARSQKLEQIRYEHKLCPQCGAVNDKTEKRCTKCGENLGGRARQMLRRTGMFSPELVSVSSLLAGAIAFCYVRVALAGGGQWGEQEPLLLYSFGGAISGGEWWRLGTYMFLHGGLWHIGFNLLALSSIGPRVEEVYGRGPMLFAYMLTGVIAMAGSLAIGGQGVHIGASGAISGLIGIALGYGHRAGPGSGHALRNDMVRWVIMLVIFGLAIGADNAAHIGGLFAGGALGYGVTPRWLRRRQLRPVVIAITLIGAALAIGAVALVLSKPTDLNYHSGQRQTEFDDPDLLRHHTAQVVKACELHQAGEPQRALELAAPAYRWISRGETVTSTEQLASLCMAIPELREMCTRMKTEGYSAVFGQLPPKIPAAERAAHIERQKTQCEVFTGAAQ